MMEIQWKEMVWGQSAGELDEKLGRLLTEATKDGAAVGDIRAIVADFKGITDCRRIMVIAEDGSRLGPLAGEDWAIQNIHDSWRCQHVVICVMAKFVALEGLGQTYLVHPTAEECEQKLRADRVRRYAASQIFRNVGQNGPSAFAVEPGLIDLTLNDRLLEDWETVLQGVQPYVECAFTLTKNAAATFTAEESWLRALVYHICPTCWQKKRTLEMPICVTSRCQHANEQCRECLRRAIKSRIEIAFWRIKCPDCPELLERADIRRLSAKETVGRYDSLMLRMRMLNNLDQAALQLLQLDDDV
ncbi:hypothetical protein B0T18DRAFT_71430 [Schizothecium vesticola]|uniref:RING-type domain-containing protein n=1 Tax=Schizothecium vesticola TaxID=314040 RepID=A0AA40F5C1_9PEZI|nr:hypothetical protein B0T18DRAFT_71430 [Schizothecium vesticola]